MKRKISLLIVAVLLSAFVFSACGNKGPVEQLDNAKNEAQKSEAPKAEAKKEEKPKAEAAVEPAPNEIVVTSDDYGDMSLTLPDGHNYDYKVAAQGEPDLEIIDTGNHFFDNQRGVIIADDFKIVMGYISFNDYEDGDDNFNSTSCYTSFDAFTYIKQRQNYTVNYGGIEAWTDGLNEVYTIVYPAISVYGARVIALVPGDYPDTTDKAEELLKLPEVKEILDTIVLKGDTVTDSRPESEKFECNYVEFTTAAGWDVGHTSYGNSGSNSYRILNFRDDVGINDYDDIFILMSKNYYSSANESVEYYEADGTRLDDITIGDITYYAVQSSARELIWLITSAGTEFTPDEGQAVEIELWNVDLETAMPLLETIKLKDFQ
ncbi:hypothetical protein LJB89_02830 [Tyzzerella sp. OttesenSCG-928-J15]|nr:hypothetical protein [Tyzzerella sp. OttesenSCG-928-J15]